VNESVVERSVDVGNAEYELALADLGSELDSGFLCNTCFFGWLYPNVSNPIHRTVSKFKLDCICSSARNKDFRDVPSSEASDNEKLEFGVVKVRELTPAIRVSGCASVSNTRTQIIYSKPARCREMCLLMFSFMFFFHSPSLSYPARELRIVILFSLP
jgi:hypothetical protein